MQLKEGVVFADADGVFEGSNGDDGDETLNNRLMIIETKWWLRMLQQITNDCCGHSASEQRNGRRAKPSLGRPPAVSRCALRADRRPGAIACGANNRRRSRYKTWAAFDETVESSEQSA